MTIQLEKVNEKARRRRRSDPDFLQIPSSSKDQNTRQGGVFVAKRKDTTKVCHRRRNFEVFLMAAEGGNPFFVYFLFSTIFKMKKKKLQISIQE